MWPTKRPCRRVRRSARWRRRAPSSPCRRSRCRSLSSRVTRTASISCGRIAARRLARRPRAKRPGASRASECRCRRSRRARAKASLSIGVRRDPPQGRRRARTRDPQVGRDRRHAVYALRRRLDRSRAAAGHGEIRLRRCAPLASGEADLDHRPSATIQHAGLSSRRVHLSDRMKTSVKGFAARILGYFLNLPGKPNNSAAAILS